MINLNRLTLMFFLALAGCATSVNTRGLRVKIIFETEFIRNTNNSCKHLGNVEAYSMWGGIAATGTGTRSAYAQLRNKVGKINGNIIYVSPSSRPSGSELTGVRIDGEAYRCKKPYLPK